MNAITTKGLCKSIMGKKVIDHVDITVKQGEIYAFLGPNGAGKTTLMRMLLSLMQPDSGTIKIFEQEMNSNNHALLRRIGNIIEYPIFYNHLTVKENLLLQCRYMGIKNDEVAIRNALKLVRLDGMDNELVNDFSAGMRQRLGIARALVHKPELLILDEPINGLDPVGIKDMRELLRFLCKEQGITILISSHILSEIEVIADTIGCIKKGKLLEEVSMEKVRESNADSLESYFLHLLEKE